MEHLADAYNGPVTLTMCGVQVPGAADLQAWRSAPTAVDTDGNVVYDLDPPTPPRWSGTITVTPDPAAPPIPLPVNGELTLSLPGGEAGAEIEQVEWTTGELLVLAVVGCGPAPF